MERPYVLSCHCGDIRLEIDAELTEVLECNCSMCGRSGFLHWKVPAKSLRLITEKRRLTTYVWRDVAGGHQFCATCGTGILRTGYPGDRVSVNARCIEGIDVFVLSIRRYDGSRAPIASSKPRIAWLTADCVRQSCSAVRLKLPVSPRDTRARSMVMLI